MKPSATLNRLRDRDAIDHDLFEGWLAARGWGLRGLEQGEYGITLEQAMLACVMQDPVLWCRAFMDEPDTGQPYTFWPYQEESIRAWRQNVIHQDGAEVGKTREITALILWGMATAFGGEIRKPWVLVGAPQQTHLDEIIMAIEEHVGESEGQGRRKPLLNRLWLKPKRTPHTMFRFRTPDPDGLEATIGRVYFRPAGHDGEAFRGVHVNALALMDEAAKIKAAKCWSEFHRAMKPGCTERVYSVPDGDNTTDFYRMTQQAVPNLPEGQPGMRLFHWPKTLMPAPFWSEERRADFIRMYGGSDTPGYQRNVLGLHGQQENPVWSWDELVPCIRDVPEYRCLKLVADAARGELHVTASRFELLMTEGRKSHREHVLTDYHEALDGYRSRDRDQVRDAVRSLLRDLLQPLGPGVYWAGADLGFAKDPTEIMLWREVGTELRRVVRIAARGVTYDLQCELIFCLDEIFGFAARWGVDFGNAGTAVVQMLHALEPYNAGDYEDRLTGFQFAGAVDAIDEDGHTLTEEDARSGADRPVRVPAKELATNLLTARFQRLGLAMPYDPEVLGHYTNHTAREGARHRIFSKHDDHTIDADRVMLLRKVFDEAGGVDVFSSGVHRRDVA